MTLLAAYSDGYSTYASGKAQVVHFTSTASKALLDRDNSVNVIAPDPVDTSFFYSGTGTS